jgi:hypothetical protein
MFHYEVFCPAEKWRELVLGPALPRQGDEFRYKDVLYKVDAAQHQAESSGPLALGYAVKLPIVYLSRMK